MKYSVNQLQTDVMARLGEISRPLSSLSDLDVPSPEDVVALKISSMLPEVGKSILCGASAEMLAGGMPLQSEVITWMMPCSLYAVELLLPEDFLRLVSVSILGWHRGVSGLILPGDAAWECQWSVEPGIAGCPARPQAYLVASGEGRKLRLLGSEGPDAALEHLSILCIPSAPDFHFPPRLYPELVASIADKIAKDTL